MLNHLKYFYLRHIKRIDTPNKFIQFFAKRYAQNIVIEENAKAFTMEQLNKRVNCLSNSLLELGLRRGDKIGVIIKNSIEFIELRLASYKTGLIFCALIDDFTEEQILGRLGKIKFKALFIEDSNLVDPILNLPDGDIPERIVAVQFNHPNDRIQDYETLIDNGQNVEPNCTINPDDPSAIGFTSGTTGESKAVVWSHRAWLQSFFHFMLNTRLTEGEMRMLQFIPFSTAGSLVILPWIASGGRMIIKKEYSPDDIAHTIEEKKITHLTMAPVFLIDFWDYCLSKKNHWNFGSLRNISVGSAPLSGSKLKQIIEFFGPIIQQSYGMAEVLAPLASLKIRDPLKEKNKLTSVGIPIKQIGIKLTEKDGKGSGYINIRSKTACLGYWDPERIDRSCFHQNWFHTDDIGYFDKKGNLYVNERKSRLIHHGETIIYPRDIEEIIHGFPSVKNVLVCKKGNILLAYLSCRRNHTIDLSELKTYCLQYLAKQFMPDEFSIKDRLPVSTSGKILAVSDQ